jgi:hypothetical protein
MNKVQLSWADVSRQLNEKLRLCKLNNSALSEVSGVDYYAIRRFNLSGVRNKTGSAKKLCTYFKIPYESTAKVQPDELSKLVSEIKAVWDGSEPHAKLLTNLIRSTKSFKVEDNKKG